MITISFFTAESLMLLKGADIKWDTVDVLEMLVRV